MIDDIRFEGSAPLQQQLYQQLSARILHQRFPPGSRLPASRLLAADLGISRNTVNAVYDQLKAEGFLQSRAGKGIFVHEDINHRRLFEQQADTSPIASAALPPLPDPRLGAPAGTLRADGKACLPFSPGLPDLEAFPIRAWNRVLHHQESRLALRGYGDFQGYRPLRQAIASYLRSSRGLRCGEHQVIITNGAQQGLSLIADVFLQPGDRVLSENPGYRGARYALERHGSTLIPVPLKQQVLDVEALTRLGPAKLLYCTPTHQYPMGGILDISQRMALVQWAMRNQTWIIEDDYDSEFHFYNKPFAAIQGMFDNAPVLYVGSFSKTLLPGLRVGYLVVPEALVEAFVWHKRISGGETPLLSQATIAEFMDSGQFSRHLRRMRQLYRDKWSHFQARVTEHLSGLVTPVAESAGMHLVLEGAFDDAEVSSKLRNLGYGSTPLSAHFIGTASRQGLVMGFASANAAQIDGCVEALASVLSAGQGRA
ncbi:MocR-like pyridoxine biosynthesis transcription factor PdxR [Marinobacter zhejiangensis]|uniref:GntR family transcriptional regulator / MocR family aminotransferase n=1 Tax=Marinobacter zhejiangensis TaxID=488535 RepID=A0A1I4LW15_9GAMM|nr:PLP-dependent aminotransferase family protein [Marinobacter zhejiangensis]SFL95132.1 GntR family transcriptional regulator / MocR family aminotransferase [Marinobacter zhejiangensis]